MKKILLIGIFVLSAGLMFGQLKFGPKIGYNASTLTTTAEGISTQFKSGFQFGAFVRLGSRVYLQPELYYSTHGGIFNGEDSLGQSYKQTLNIGSLDIPVLIGFKILNTDLVNLRIMVGPAMSLAVNKKITNANDIIGPIKKADISTANWYIQAGAGIDVWLFTLDVRYQLGLNKIIKDVTFENNTINFNTSNNVWVVSLGFKI